MGGLCLSGPGAVATQHLGLETGGGETLVDWRSLDAGRAGTSGAASWGFQVLPRRWVVERTLAWLGRNRRLAKDYEFLPETEEAFVYAGMVRLMLRRLAKVT